MSRRTESVSCSWSAPAARKEQATAKELVLVQNWAGELTRVVPRERYKVS